MPSYTPTTTLSPTAVNQDSGKLDEMIGIVQGMLQQRQQSRDSAFRGEQMQRTMQVWLEEDQNRALTSRQDQNFRSLATNRNFNTEQVNQMLLDKEINPNQANALIPLAIDYVSPEQRAASLASALEAGQVNSLEALYSLASEAGVEENTARWLWNEHQQKTRPTGSGSGSGGGTGRGGGGDAAGGRITNVVADLAMFNDKVNFWGLQPTTLPATPENAEHFQASLQEVARAESVYDASRSKVRGVLQNVGRISVGASTASFGDIPGFAGYTVRVNEDGDVTILNGGRRVSTARDPKAAELLGMVSGARASDLRDMFSARQRYRDTIRRERDRLNSLNSQRILMDRQL